MSTLLDEIIPLLEAARSGKTIQESYLQATKSVWSDVPDPANHQWNFSVYQYRVKPAEPREFWLVESLDSGPDWVVMESREWAERYAHPKSTVIHVREVVP